MNPDTRNRAVLPFAIPVGILAFIAAELFVMSRILLNVPNKAAVSIALFSALAVLGVCALASARPEGRRIAPPVLATLGSIPVLVGIVVALTVGPTKHEAEPAGPPAEVAVEAEALKFSTAAITLPASKNVTIAFTNSDSAPHNIAVYKTAGATEAIFTPPGVVSPGAKADYKFKSPPAGTYFYECEVHPTLMTGTLTTTEGGGEGGGTKSAGGGPIEIGAKDLKFSKNTIEVTANDPVTIEFKNEDAVPHNLAFYEAPDATKSIFVPTAPASAGQTVTYKFEAPAAGTYFFRCDIHPTQMTGVLTAK